MLIVISELKNVLQYHRDRFKLIFTEDLGIKMKKVVEKLPWGLTGHHKNKINEGNKNHLEVNQIFFKKSQIFLNEKDFPAAVYSKQP